MGRLLAWQLLKLGHSVSLYEKSSFNKPQSAAHTAAAMISPLSEVVVSERSIYDMGMASLKLWPTYIAELNQNAHPAIHYSANGSIVVAHESDASELEQFYQDLQWHLGGDNRARWLSPQELSEYEPDLAHQFNRALYLPEEAALDNRHLMDQLLSTIKAMGGQCHDNCDFAFMPEPMVNGAVLESVDLCIDCRGIGARQNNHQVRGVRGEVLWVETSEVQLKRPVRFMHPRYKLYIVPKPNNRFIIGATEIESEDRSPVSVQSMLELCSALYTLNPAFAEARILELDANLRPSLWDNLPKFEEHWQQPVPTLSVNGLYRHGYLLAPTLVEDILQRVATRFEKDD